MTQHTPAPWVIKQVATSKINAVKIVSRADHSEIASIKYAYINTPQFGEGASNANLIRTAPELLAALQALMNQAVKDAEKYAPEGNEPIWAFISDAADAISKATNI